MVAAPSPEVLRELARQDVLVALRGVSAVDQGIVIAEVAADLARQAAQPAEVLALILEVARERVQRGAA